MKGSHTCHKAVISPAYINNGFMKKKEVNFVKVKKTVLMMLFFSILVFCSACVQSGDGTAAESNAPDTSSGDQAGTESNAGDTSPEEIDASLQERPRPNSPDLVGRVQSIEGNELTLLIAEMPQRGEGPQLGEAPNGPPDQKEREDDTRQTEDPAPQERRQPMNEDIKFTEETKKVLIPQETPISLGAGEAATELKFSDIQVDMVLQIWFEAGDESGAQTVKNVRIIPVS